MKKNKYNIRFAVLIYVSVFAAFLLGGCKKNFLDRQPQGQYTEETYPILVVLALTIRTCLVLILN